MKNSFLGFEDHESGLENDLEEILKNFESDDNPFDDDLPEPGTPLYRIMRDNNIYHTKQRKIYERYNTSNLGCNINNPIVINETEKYVHLEYELLEYIMRPTPFRFVDYEVMSQELLSDNDKCIDKLTLEVSKHPLLSLEELENISEPVKEVLGQEDYFFDISVGINRRWN